MINNHSDRQTNSQIDRYLRHSDRHTDDKQSLRQMQTNSQIDRYLRHSDRHTDDKQSLRQINKQSDR